MTPRARLALLVALVTAVPLVLAALDVVSPDGLRDALEPAGPFAPVAWVLLSGLLGALLVPGPLLAATSGLLFGAGLGTATTLASALLSAVVARALGARAGRAGAEQVLGERAPAVERAVTRHGALAVVVQRLLPGVPDGPMNYAFGALGVTARQILLGTLVGTLPRAFSYTALGAAVDDPTSPLALAGVVGLVLTAVLGAVVGQRVWSRLRR